MKCLIKNMLPGPVVFEDFSLKFKEEKQVEYTDRLRYYVSMGYVKLVDMYPESDTAPVVAKKKKIDN